MDENLVYLVSCSVPPVQAAGEWKLNTTLDGVLVHSRTVAMVCPKHEFENEASQCQDCMPGVRCETPGNKLHRLRLIAGFWRSSPTSTEVLKCPYGTHACHGSNANGTNSTDNCKPGYVGPICATCDTMYFFSWADEQCLKCEDAKSHAASIIVGTCLLAIAAVVGVALFFGEVADNARAAVRGRAATVTARVQMKLEDILRAIRHAVHKFKSKAFVLLVTAQVQAQVVAVAGRNAYPQPARGFVNALGFTNFDFMMYVPAECVHPEATFYTKLVIKTVGPLVACLFMWMPALCLLVAKLYLNMVDRRNHERRAQLEQRIQYWSTMAIYASTVFLELILPSVSTTIAQTFMCEEIGGKKFLREHLILSCKHSDERSWWVSYATGMGFVYPVRAASAPSSRFAFL